MYIALISMCSQFIFRIEIFFCRFEKDRVYVEILVARNLQMLEVFSVWIFFIK